MKVKWQKNRSSASNSFGEICSPATQKLEKGDYEPVGGRDIQSISNSWATRLPTKSSRSQGEQSISNDVAWISGQRRRGREIPRLNYNDRFGGEASIEPKMAVRWWRGGCRNCTVQRNPGALFVFFFHGVDLELIDAMLTHKRQTRL